MAAHPALFCWYLFDEPEQPHHFVTADRLIELERVVNARTRELVRWKLAAIDAIRAVEEPRLSEVLELYYIDGLTWEQVAQRMGLDVRWVYRLHGMALMMVTVPEEAETDAKENT